MILRVWRITKRSLTKTAFSGEGARRYGGRWNSPGLAVIYAAQSRALAALEMLIHLDEADLLDAYVLMPVDVDGSRISEIDQSALPLNWQKNPPPSALRDIGDNWIVGGKSVALRVPSAVVPGESNYLLNPRHKDFQKLKIGEPQPFQFDVRLKVQ